VGKKEKRSAEGEDYAVPGEQGPFFVREEGYLGGRSSLHLKSVVRKTKITGELGSHRSRKGDNPARGGKGGGRGKEGWGPENAGVARPWSCGRKN